MTQQTDEQARTAQAWQIINRYLANPSADDAPGPRDVEAALAILKQRDQSEPARPTVLNVGDGRVAVIDTTRPGPPQIMDFNDPKKADLEVQRLEAQIERERSGIKTPEQAAADLEDTKASIDARRAQTANTQAQTANMETPSERMARTIAAQRAQAEALVKSKLDLVASGVEMTERDRLELESQLKVMATEHSAQLAALRDEQEFERTRPFKEAEAERGTRQLDISQQQADTAAQIAQQSAAYQEGQLDVSRQNTDISRQHAETQRLGEVRQQRKSVADPLLKQSETGAGMLMEMAKAGTAPIPGASKALVFSPLENALSIIDAGVRRGEIPKEWVPEPAPPLPAGMTREDAMIHDAIRPAAPRNEPPVPV